MNGPLTVKLGGAAGQHLDALGVIARNAPADTVVVHGGGSEVGDWSRRLGLEPQFRDGLRVTDRETLDVVVAVLGGLINARLVAYLTAAGRQAIGLTGADAHLLTVQPHPDDIGHVGEVTRVGRELLHRLVEGGLTPVVAPIGSDGQGNLYNVNADDAAAHLAAARGGTLLLCTDVAAVLRDEQPVSQLDLDAAREMLADGSAVAGMRPKLRAALLAAEAGCTVRIIDGRSPQTVEAALNGELVGTTVTASVVASQEVS